LAGLLQELSRYQPDYDASTNGLECITDKNLKIENSNENCTWHGVRCEDCGADQLDPSQRGDGAAKLP
jgi:hypothetical protein